jgi:hypothetical protein
MFKYRVRVNFREDVELHNIFLDDFYFKDWLKYMNLELDLEKLLEMLLLPSSMRIFGSV